MELFIYIIIAVAAALAGFFAAKTRVQAGDAEKYTQLERENAALASQVDSLQNQLATGQQQLVQMQKQLDDLRAEQAREVVQLNNQLSAANAQCEHLQKRLLEQKQDMETVRKKFIEDFEAISNKVLRDNSSDFSKMSQEQLKTVLKPMQERLLEFGQRVEHNQKQQIEYHTQLRTQIEHLSKLNQTVGEEAQNLARALKGESKMQGNWGENILTTLLEKAGLMENEHFFREKQYQDDNGKAFRPDVIVNLPDEKCLIIDSKVSLTAYEAYYNAEDPTEKKGYLDAHILSMRNHIRGLSGKDYTRLNGLGNNPDYVLMFIPLEPAFNLAVRSHAGLFEEALKHKIVLVTTTTLLATLVTVSAIWKQKNQQENVLKIANEAGALYDKFRGFTEDLTDMGSQLDRLKKSYGGAVNKLLTGRGNAVSKAEQIRELGVSVKKAIDQEKMRSLAERYDPISIDAGLDEQE